MWSQVYVYAETNFQFGRYYLPFLFGLPLSLSLLNNDKINPTTTDIRRSVLYYSSIFVVCSLLIYNVFGVNTIQKVKNLERSKRLTTKLFYSVEAFTSENDSILIVGDPGANYEAMSLGYPQYIQTVLNRNKLFYLPLEVNYNGEKHLKMLKNDFLKKNKTTSIVSNDITLDNFRYILVLNSVNWYKGKFFSDNLKMFSEIFLSRKSDNCHFFRLKFGRLTSYVRHEGAFIDGKSPLFDEVPIYIKSINGSNLSYKDLGNLNSWKTPDSDTFIIEGVIHDIAPMVYLGIDTSFVSCSINTNLKRKKKPLTKFKCIYDKSLLMNHSEHVITPVVISKDSNSYRFLSKPYNQPRFSIN